jgi:hypothetical protein
MLKRVAIFVAGVLLGLIGAVYVFVLNGYQTTFIPRQSERWYQLIKEGSLPAPLILVQSDVRSNGYVVEVFGTVENIGPQPIRLGKVSADLFNAKGTFIHKCEYWIPFVEPKSRYNFRFHCANLSDLKPPEYATGKVYIDA